MLYLLALVLQLSLGVFIIFLCLSFVTGAPFVPSTTDAARTMVDNAHIEKGSVVYDLGSGSGKILILSASRGATAIGFEINPFLVLFTRFLSFFSPHRNRIRVYWKDFWKRNYKDADVVFIYLLPWRMSELKAKLIQELKPGARIVSNSFLFPDWKPVYENLANHVFVYKIS